MPFLPVFSHFGGFWSHNDPDKSERRSVMPHISSPCTMKCLYQDSEVKHFRGVGLGCGFLGFSLWNRIEGLYWKSANAKWCIYTHILIWLDQKFWPRYFKVQKGKKWPFLTILSCFSWFFSDYDPDISEWRSVIL